MSELSDKCGTSLEENNDTPAPRNKKNPLVKYAVAALSVALAIILILILIANTGYRKAVNDMERFLNGNFKKIETLAPDEYWQDLADYYSHDVDKMLKNIKRHCEKAYADNSEGFGKDFKYNIKIEDTTKVSSKKLKTIAKSLNEEYSIKETELKKAYELKIEISVKQDGKTDTTTKKVTVLKLGGSWYVADCYEDDGDVFVDFFDF